MQEQDAIKEEIIRKKNEKIQKEIIKKEKKLQKAKSLFTNFSEYMHDNPIEDYPLARQIKRKFILHVGPTNSGKTYNSLERLGTARHGMYLGPLRLLALEVYDKFTDKGISSPT